MATLRTSAMARVVLLALVASALGLRAQQTPTFRANTDLVVVDFTATAKDGRPIDDLKKEELILRVGGKLREIRTLEFVRLADPDRIVDTPPAKPAPAATFPPSPFGSNVPRDTGRTIYIVIDDESMPQGSERSAREAVERLLATLPARDRVGLVTIPNGAIAIEPTIVRPRLRAALSKVTGHLEVPAGRPNSGFDAVGAITASLCQTARHSLAAIDAMFRSLTDISGPKTIVLISAGVLADEKCGFDPGTLEDLRRAAAKARAQFYVVQPHLGGADARSFVPQSDLLAVADRLAQGAEDLAGVSGGELFRISGTADAAFAKIARASSAQYLLGFDAEPGERDGKTHGVSLSTTRTGIDLRARPQFEIPTPDAHAKAAETAKTVPLERVLADRRSFSDLPLSIVAHAARTADRQRLKVIVTADSLDVATPIASASFALIDPKDRVVANWIADADDLKLRPIVSATVVPAGEYRVRVAARDAAGRLGAADFEFEAKLRAAGDFELSDLLFGFAREDTFVPKFQYATETAALAYLEIYALTSDLVPPKVIFQIASATDGPTRAEALGKINYTRERDRWFATASVPLVDLPAGDYVARALLLQGTRIVGVAFRTIRKTAALPR